MEWLSWSHLDRLSNPSSTLKWWDNLWIYFITDYMCVYRMHCIFSCNWSLQRLLSLSPTDGYLVINLSVRHSHMLSDLCSHMELTLQSTDTVPTTNISWHNPFLKFPYSIFSSYFKFSSIRRDIWDFKNQKQCQCAFIFVKASLWSSTGQWIRASFLIHWLFSSQYRGSHTVVQFYTTLISLSFI